MTAARCVFRRLAAMLAVLAALLAAPRPGFAQGTLERPVEVRARTVTGATFVGKLTAWTEDGFTGSFGDRRWSDLVAPDLRRVYAQVMDKASAAQWLRLGELLAAAKDGRKLADDAFGQAKRVGATAEQVDAARVRASGAAKLREERDRMDRERQLQQDTLPDDATARPWPVLSDGDRTAAVDRMRGVAKEAMDVAGVRADTVETEFFIVTGDLPKADLQRWGRELDAMYARVAEMLQVPKGINLFWGKAVVLLYERQESFRLSEAAVFRHKAPATLRGICHMTGPQVAISAYRGNTEAEFASTLVHETLHGIVHRYATPARLPDWANEGFAEWIARACVPNGRVDQNRRPQGLAFFRQGGDAAKVMALSGAEGTWPGDNAIGYSVGFLLVDLMIADRPQKFGAWVKAVKGGKPWQQALAEDFGVDAGRLAASASQWYRTNDGAPRR
ncbi:MAG: hypothetical protein FJ260_03260 [Planctomycetes bacterium]|nr:hypothetical protein [Planctomycetota bacterium]